MFSLSYRIGLNKTVPNVLRKTLDERAFRSAQLVLGFIKAKMAEPKTGRWYIIPGTTQKYRASAPGEYPAIRTKALHDSLRIGLTSTPGRAFIGTSVLYGKSLEDRPVALGGRPWLGRAMQDLRADIERIWKVPITFGGPK